MARAVGQLLITWERVERDKSGGCHNLEFANCESERVARELLWQE